MIGKQAPAFSCEAVVNGETKKISLDDYKGKHKVIFFYPKDFTFVCPTELHAFQDALPEFEKRNVQVIGCSVDDCATHLKWLDTPKKMGGIEGISYPLIADTDTKMAQDYGVFNEKECVAYRGAFLLDKDNVVQSMMVNNLSLGRSVDEILRLVDALQFVEEHGKVCPVNWQQGESGIEATKEGVIDFFNES